MVKKLNFIKYKFIFCIHNYCEKLKYFISLAFEIVEELFDELFLFKELINVLKVLSNLSEKLNSTIFTLILEDNEMCYLLTFCFLGLIKSHMYEFQKIIQWD